jgi:aminoglycoside phosphotransferase family enzyme/predicted kinase
MHQPDQDEIVDFLSSDTAFGGEPVRHVQTHLSHVFLAGDRAWKMKRAVRFTFVDFSTADLRRASSEREVLLNRRTAPALYLGVVPVTWDGRNLAVAGQGEAVDWLVEMRRFDERALLSRCARSGRLTRDVAASLAEHVIAFHDTAERRTDKGGAATLRSTARDVAANLVRYAGTVLRREAIDSWAERIDRTLLGNEALLDGRRDAGFVRRCHGDMHLANICLLDGEPILFDCIEFNDDFSCIDVMYDLAFLLMDLIHHGASAMAGLVLNRYLSATADYGALPVLPALLSLRAAIRGMASLIEASDEDDEGGELGRDARLHFDLAHRLLERPSPRLVGIGGFSGTGKSTLAAALALRLAPGAGAVVISSDVIRKRLFGRRPEEKLGRDAYAGPVSAQVYDKLYSDVRRALEAGQVVIADATWLREEDRRALAVVAADCGMRFSGLWLETPIEMLRERISARTGDPSDADVTVLTEQLTHNVGIIDWTRLDTPGPGLVTEALLAISA